MMPEEEASEIKDYNEFAQTLGNAPEVKDIETSLKKIHFDACSTLKENIINLNLRVDDKNVQLRDYLHIEDAPLRAQRGEMMSSVRERQKAEKIRLKAKKMLLLNDIETSKAELSKVPKKVCWDRYPLVHNDTPLYEKIIPILWDIEQRLFNGENIYLYSKEGKGRSGMLCALVMGRIYGLTATDTLLRMQTYFDCQKSQQFRSVSANCPQLRRQQDLVFRILQSTNMIYSGIQYRSQIDPETFISENQHLKAGTPTLQNTKEYSPSIGGYIQNKTSFIMKQKPPTEKFKQNALAILSNSSSSLPQIQENNTEALILPSRNRELEKLPLKKVVEEDENQQSLIKEISAMFENTSIDRGSAALLRPIEQRRPVYCDRPSQVHINKTFSKAQKQKPNL